jgi:hypothetical protein
MYHKPRQHKVTRIKAPAMSATGKSANSHDTDGFTIVAEAVVLAASTAVAVVVAVVVVEVAVMVVVVVVVVAVVVVVLVVVVVVVVVVVAAVSFANALTCVAAEGFLRTCAGFVIRPGVVSARRPFACV